MRVVALIAAYNEELFIERCLEHLFQSGVEAYLLDNESKDATVSIAGKHLGNGLLGIETIPRPSGHDLKPILQRKEVLAANLPADWFLNVDADEMHLPPWPGSTLPEAFGEVEERGFNAVNFLEFTFLPTLEDPDHEGRDFRETLRWYYPFLPFSPHLLRAWKAQPAPVDLAGSAGHQVRFPGRRIFPELFWMRHFLFLSVPHAIRKWVQRGYNPEAVARGWHGWRARLEPGMIRLPRRADLREQSPGEPLDPSRPRTRHWLEDCAAACEERKA